MKKILFLIGFISYVSIAAMAQSVSPDPRLDAVYSEEYLQELVSFYPQDLAYKNWCLDNSYTIVQLPIEKCQKMPYLKHFDPVNKIIGDNVEDVDEGNFNVYKYYFERQYDRSVYYRIGNSGKAIAFDSFLNLTKEFNK